MLVVGVDGIKAGWIAVALVDGRFAKATALSDAQAVADAFPEARVVGIDIPIGLPEHGVRAADRAARRFVGGRRASSVFTAPPRRVLEAATYEAARATAATEWTQGVSAQAYRLGPKILEVAELSDDRFVEVHPEVSFRELLGRPVEHYKKTWNGQMERRAALAGVGIHLPDSLPAGNIPADDLLDAAVAAWSAGRHALGDSRSLPDPPPIGPGGAPIAIWY